ncbi:unnamed protein product [Owenia fusiformis]|uniref:Uncharacterized protein n=1 Tax=Owenia fusiformis TaxID=6347 RepID=A0A8S4Q604_OWEFU|nr:unnamed protein product [Owenia fusiformis]
MEVCFLSAVQGPLQAFLRPGLWFPGLNLLHTCTEQWVSTEPPDVLLDDLVHSIEAYSQLEQRESWCNIIQLHKVDRENNRVTILAYTRAEWLDVVEIDFNTGKARSFSSGIFPTFLPLAVLLNCVLFFVPFLDHGVNKKRLDKLRSLMTSAVGVDTEEQSLITNEH